MTRCQRDIVDFYRELYSNIDKEHFLLLYLYSDKLEEYINAIKKERSDNQGNELWYPMMLEYLKHWPYGEKYGCSTFEDMIRHFGHRQSLEMRINCGILSIFSRATSKYIRGAKRKFPFDIFTLAL